MSLKPNRVYVAKSKNDQVWLTDSTGFPYCISIKHEKRIGLLRCSKDHRVTESNCIDLGDITNVWDMFGKFLLEEARKDV